MKKNIYIVIQKICIIFLSLCIFVFSINFLKSQSTQEPQNPITQKQSKSNIVIENSKTQIDKDILDLKSDILDAQMEQTDGNNVSTSKDQLQQINDGDNIKQGDGNPTDGGKGEIPGGGSFELPADGNYFFVNLIDVKDPYKIEDPRCYYKITHIYPNLKVEKIVFYNNNKITKYTAENPNKGFINLNKGENWLKVRITYRLPNGSLETYERSTNPPMVKLLDPLDIDFSNTNLRNTYDNPQINFFVKPNPTKANVQVIVNGNLLSIDSKGNYNATLKDGDNQIIFKGSVKGYHNTEIIKKVTYKRTSIKVYSKELEALDYYSTGKEYLNKSITLSTRVEYITNGLPVTGVKLEITLQGKKVYSADGGSHDNIVLNLPIGMNQIIISARGSNSNNNATEFVSKKYVILKGQGDPPPQNVQDETKTGANIGTETVVNNPVFDFRISPTTINSLNGNGYAITEHKQYVYHTSATSSRVPVICRENIMGIYCYSVYLNEGRNEIELVLVTDELYKLTYKYIVYYVPTEDKGEKLGKMFISIDASVLGIPIIASGYVDFYKDKPLSYAVLDLLKQNGFTAKYNGESNYSMYLSDIIKKNILSGWDESKISAVERAFIEEAGGDSIWHGSYSKDSLGAGDFTSKSGWMVTLNDNQIRGLSIEYPKDGDVCKIMFTLTGGSDLKLK